MAQGMTPQRIEQQIEQLGPWFYEFELGANRRTRSELPAEVTAIFQTRLEMVNAAVESHFGSRLSEATCIDVGCHEGFYSIAMARKGVKHVAGYDLRERNVEKARFVAEALGVTNVAYHQGNCEDLSVESAGRHDLCLFLGLLYHLENPMLCLRNISAVTKQMCVVETQVVQEVEGASEWGAKNWTRDYQGVLALIDESNEYYAENGETGASPVAACPSPKALTFMLRQAGFQRTEFIDPPPDAYEQHKRGKRVVCAAYK